jgi:hypothetical protein
MTRRRAALLGGALAVLLAGVYLPLRRRTGAAAGPVTAAGPTATLPTAPAVAAAVAADIRPPPPPPPPAGTVAPESTEPVEQPLPTWVRLGIVAAALLAFFAVSLVATKQV